MTRQFINFDFEELMLPEFGEGAMFYGQARLVPNGDSNDTFIVADIRLINGNLIWRGSTTVLERELFNAISQVLYDDKYETRDGKTYPSLGTLCQQAWDDAIEADEATGGVAYTQAGHGTLNHEQQFGR